MTASWAGAVAEGRLRRRTAGTSITSMPSRLASRNEVQKALHAAGIGTGIHYPVPVHCRRLMRASDTGEAIFR